MADIAQLRTDVQQSRHAASDARARAAAARERLAALRLQLQKLARVSDKANDTAAVERRRLEAEIAKASAENDQAQAEATRLAAAAAAALAAFVKAADPRTGIGGLNDAFPILMMPVRLETRFKQDPRQPQLLVRIYPDDCSIDSFEPVLSENEVKSANDFWLAMFAAGKVPDQERGAWRVLAGGYGSGRAEWIITNYVPLNLDADPTASLAAKLALIPKKALPDDLVLTIGTEAPPPDADATALGKYWSALWLAAGDKAAVDAAHGALVTATDSARADALIADFVPSNIKAKPSVKPVNVSTVFVHFPPAAGLKSHSWSRPATAELLPDVFVFIGINGGVQEVFQVGQPVISPLEVSPDPSAPEAKQLRHGPDGELIFPDEMQWMVDFDRALASGMAFRISLTPAKLAQGFERVLVIGIRLSSDEALAQKELETLITHQRFSRDGYAIVPQGTPTNNTDSGSSGFSRTDDPDATYDALTKPALFTETSTWLDKADGQWLAELLGISTTAVQKIENSDGRDQADARAVNIALWPATLGYWMQTMMSPIFSDAVVNETRSFFNRFVLGRGSIPAVRIGKQPYGILPATAFSRMQWLNPSTDRRMPFASSFLARLYQLLELADADWKTMSGEVAFTGKSGDPHQLLLDIIGLNSGSVEFAQRYGESIQQLYNRLSIEGLGPLVTAFIIIALEQGATDLLTRLGYTGNAPDIQNKFFIGDHNALKGPLIDDRPLSEDSPIRKYTADGTQNYIEWLIAASGKSLDALYQQEGFKDDKPPEALLYLLLRHALQLSYHDTSVQLHLAAGLLTADTARAARIDDTFIHIRQTPKPFESRYGLLYKPELAITGDAVTTVGDFIGRSLAALVAAAPLRDQLDALDRLKDASTSRLERALTEHIDCCSYRLDAWLLALVTFELATMRNTQEGAQGPRKEGIYIGAYAWLENLKPDNRVLTPVTIADPALASDFADGPPLMSDSTNEGFIHAPSLNQAVTAAVLRNGYISNAAPSNPTSMAVSLTSDRVRTAVGILEGIRGGQSLGALLGYQLERALHDDHSFGVELDQFIFKLRREFPLASNRLASTRIDSNDLAIESIEARNVVDGLALANYIRSSGNAAYPFGKPRLPHGTPAQEAAITAEAAKILDTWDAVADLALSEGVFQAVVGNYDRVASTLDAYSKGNFPPEPQVIWTPTSGMGVTHRVAVQFELGDADPGATPRAVAEPGLNRWLASILPPMNQIGCMVDYRDVANTAKSKEILLSALNIQPADLLQLLREDKERSLAELDERIMTIIAPLARPDSPITIRYMDKDTAAVSLFELSPLVRHLRRLLTAARPLRSTDLSLTNEARRDDNADVFVDRARIAGARTALGNVLTDLNNFDTNELKTPLGDVVAHRGDILAKIDGWIDTAVSLLSRAALFSIPQSGWGFGYDFRARIFRDLIAKASALVIRWNGRLADYDAAIAAYDLLPGPTPDADRFQQLANAERLISTQTMTPAPATPLDYRTRLDTKRAAFVAKHDQFVAIGNTNRQKLSDLLGDIRALLPVDAFEFPALSISAEEDQVIAFAQDVQRVEQVIGRECDRRGKAADGLLAQHDSAASAAARVDALTAAAKALFGDDFLVVPEFSLPSAQGDELASSFGSTASLLDYLVNTIKTEQPVDTWMYGVARVRERMRHWEQIVMLAGALGGTEPALTPLQLPFDAADRWLALDVPPDVPLDHERLLYTAHFSKPFDKSIRQCGLLIDEWTETIPSPDTTTGLGFHYDRPNNEAPQAMLLLTPAAFRGAWQWNDVVDALNETLDLAKRRAVEPVQIDETRYAQFLPATIMAVTMNQITISANLAINNSLARFVTP
ncbi:MAG TPA: hypothetical protein VEZ11_00385 [Thermoanaerobaculia bacterium]|nr:hypothetical protein [Thermoanaerobaculia bacterium]